MLTLNLIFGENREYKPLESIKDNYPKYVATLDSLLQQRNGILHINLVDFMKNGKSFQGSFDGNILQYAIVEK